MVPRDQQDPNRERLTRIQRSDRIARKCCQALSKNSMQLGLELAAIFDEQGWLDLGYASPAEYCASMGLGRSTAYKMVRIANQFDGIDPEKLFAMSVENAALLAECDQQMRYNDNLLRKAGELSVTDFQKLLSQQNETTQKLVNKAPHLPVRLPRPTECAIEVWRQEHGIANRQTALALIVSEVSERGTLTGFLLEWTKRLGAAKDADLRNLVHTFVNETREMLAALQR